MKIKNFLYKKNHQFYLPLIIFTFLVLFYCSLYLVNVIKANQDSKISSEISIHSLSPLGLSGGKITAASCGVPSNPWRECTVCTTCSDGSKICNTGSTQCSKIPPSWCTASAPPISACPTTTCTNGYTNYPTCGPTSCSNGATNYPDCNNNICSNGATNYPDCNNISQTCTGVDGCGVTKTGTTNPATGLCVVAEAPTCSRTNSCGGTSDGFQCASGCTASPNNNDCITDFTVTTNYVNPNGSVEFSWKTKPGVGSTCGFVDLTTPTPRQIPGLQNLDVNTDRIRISNIQTTTRFCLVCQFYNLANNAAFGEAAVHQWVRVIRIGEN